MSSAQGRDGGLRLRSSDVDAVVAEAAWPLRAEDGDRIGLEVELLAIVQNAAGTRRARLMGAAPALLPLLDALADQGTLLRPREPEQAVPRYEVRHGGWLTFEPGGQVEVSAPPCTTPAAALDAATGAASVLAAALRPSGVALVAAGVDAWHDIAPLQLGAPRYTAMAAYLAARGRAGALMMRHTCSLQVNVDAGSGMDRQERWLAANLLAPLLVATFANSPSRRPAAASRRALLWQALDPTRTGFPPRLLHDRDPPDALAALVDAALRADVLLVRTAGGAVPGEPGWTFGAWLRDGHPEHGRPTAEDLRYHLTTLFHEVRPRGWLELRSLDAQPGALRPLPVLLVAGALLDPAARGTVLDLLLPHRHRLPALLRRAALRGLADPLLRRLAAATWSAALDGAARLRSGAVTTGDLMGAAELVDGVGHDAPGPALASHAGEPGAVLAALAESVASSVEVTLDAAPA